MHQRLRRLQGVLELELALALEPEPALMPFRVPFPPALPPERMQHRHLLLPRQTLHESWMNHGRKLTCTKKRAFLFVCLFVCLKLHSGRFLPRRSTNGARVPVAQPVGDALCVEQVVARRKTVHFLP